MSGGAQPSVLGAFRAFKTLGFWRHSKTGSVLSSLRLYSSVNNRDGLDKPEVISQEEEEPELPEPVSGDGGQHLDPLDPSGPTKCESITERLRRLSETSPEKFVPTASTREEMEAAKARYKNILMQYRQRYAEKDRQRFGNSNHRHPRGRSAWDDDDDGYRRGGRDRDMWDNDQQYRRFSSSCTTTTIFGRTDRLRPELSPKTESQSHQVRSFSTSSALFSEGAEGEGILDRLKRLSLSSEKEYKPSEGAREVRKATEARSRSVGHLHISEFDQTKDRPPSRPDKWGRHTSQYAREHENSRRNSWSSSEDKSRFNDRRNDNRNYGSNNRGRRNPWSKNRGGDDDFDPMRDPKVPQFRNREDQGSQFPRPRTSYYGDNKNRPVEESQPLQAKYQKYTSSGVVNERRYWDPEPSGSTSSSQFKENQKGKILRDLDAYRRMKPMSISKSEESDSMAMGLEYASNPESFAFNSPTKDNQSKRIVQDADLDLAAIHGDPDTFGTLSLGSIPVNDPTRAAIKRELMEDQKEFGLSELDEDEDDDGKFIPDIKWNMDKLERRIKELIEEQKVKEAVDTLLGALAQGGFHYNRYQFVYCYNLCISSCALVGYVEMAFKLFTDMTKRGFPPKPSTYTSLFNACSNSPWERKNNIERMDRLRNSMLEKGIPINQVHYHAMIKGYGRCGDLQGAFGIVDEMITHQQIQPSAETFNMLLQACISDKDNGFRHALVTWRKMQSMQIRPDIFSYNLLLRAVRECGIQLQLTEEEEAEKRSKKTEVQPRRVPLLPAVVTDEESNEMLNLICVSDPSKSLENINSEGEITVTSYEEVIKALEIPENRLSVLGGLRGIMSQMSMDKVGPNLKTVTELSQLITPNDSGDLLMMLKTYKLKPDVDFFNLIIKRFFELENDFSARNLLKALPEYGLTPNIMTWGVVATGCRTWYAANKILAEMDQAHFMPNIQIMGAFLGKATASYDPKYVYRLMEEMTRREIIPDEKFILRIHEFRETVKKGIVSQEMGKQIDPPKLREVLENNWNDADWGNFLKRYKAWMPRTEVRIEPDNPWAADFETFKKYKKHDVSRDAEDDSAAPASFRKARAETS